MNFNDQTTSDSEYSSSLQNSDQARTPRQQDSRMLRSFSVPFNGLRRISGTATKSTQTQQSAKAKPAEKPKVKSCNKAVNFETTFNLTPRFCAKCQTSLQNKMTNPKLPAAMNAEKFPKVLKDIDTFIFDADGVLWLGEDVMPGSPEFLDHLIRLGKRVIVLTNNATKSRAVYAKKLANLGYHASLTKDSIVNPAAVVADTLHRAGVHRDDKKVYMIGSQGIQDELDNLKIQYFGTGPDPISRQADTRPFIYDLELDEEIENVGAVVVGYDKHFNYHKLMKAANYLGQDESCIFIATNTDETCPGPNPDTIIPDAGPIVASVQVACGREPIVVGKPHTPAFDYICHRWNINPDRTMMIGDRTNTDVKFGRDHGLRTMLVLSGCHQVDDIVDNQLNNRDDMVPEFYAECLGALVPKRSQA